MKDRARIIGSVSALLLLAGPLCLKRALANAPDSEAAATAAKPADVAASEKTEAAGAACRIFTVKPHNAPEPHSAKPEAPQVMEILQSLTRAYTDGDLTTYEKFLDERCSSFDEKTNHMIEGKGAIIDHLKTVFARHAKGGSEPLVSYTIDQPYVKVTGDMAVATFLAVQQTGGSKPEKAVRLTTDVFVKQGDLWKLTHDSGEWKPAPKI